MPPITILNVEDYAASREATTALLRQADYTVVEAATGQEALRLAEAVKPHLVLLDVKLPDLSGYEVCQRLKSDPATSSILVLQISGSMVESQDKARGLDGGADAYLLKPVNSSELLATIRALLRLRQAELQVRENEERLRMALDAAVLGTWDLNLETDQIIWSGHHAEIFGLPPDAQMLRGAEFLEMVHPADRAGVNEAMKRALAEGERFRLDYRIVRPTGEVRWINTQGQVHRDSTGRALRIVGIVRDITERKLIEADRERLLEREREARAEAEAATRAKDEFLALVSHELRTPLSSMLGWAQMLQARPPGTMPDIAKLDHALTVIERNARTQMRLVEDLLDVARIISGKLRVEPRLLELMPLLETVCEGLRPAAEAAGIQLRMVKNEEPTVEEEKNQRRKEGETRSNAIHSEALLPHQQTALVLGDPDRIQQIIWNLLSNAIKFTPSGGLVELRTTQSHTHVRISVRDNGKGIAPDFLPFIFERFRQADHNHTQRQGGLGLGLALTQHLVELHGGTVEAESAGKNQGATFTVQLPLAEVRNAELRAQSAPSAALIQQRDGVRHITNSTSNNNAVSDPQSDLLANVQVLLVEDDEFARELVQLILEQVGAQVTTAASVKEAMSILTALPLGQHPAVLVSDISMPEEDGYALIRQVRALPPEQGGKMFAIALTAYGRPEDRVRVMAAGFHTHVVKPVEPEELIAVIASLVGRLANRALA
jgi:PAS domain S-box-containing protein